MSSASLSRTGDGRGVRPPRDLWRATHPRIPFGRGKTAQFVTTRVRAIPAITPTLSFGLAMSAIGLGLWGALFPRNVARTFGLPRNDLAVRTLFGARQLVTGYALAADPIKAETLWARVGGDLIDLSVLSAASIPQNSKRDNARFAIKAMLVIAALDLFAAVRTSNAVATAAEKGAPP